MELNSASSAPTQQDLPGLEVKFDLDAFAGDTHFVGIGGIGMSALARLLLARGKQVSGSDQQESEITQELEHLGAKIFIGHQASNVIQAGVVVVSTAITDGNPEFVQAKEMKLPILHRSQILAQLSKNSKLIAISGTHGKTTTTGMIAQMLLDCGLDPSIVVGGIFERIGSNAHQGKGEYFVAETDESDRTHGTVQSYISVLTNIEADHLENYPGGIEQIRDLMLSFANNSKCAIVMCADDPGCQSIASAMVPRVIRYGRRSAGKALDYSYESLPGAGMQVFEKAHMLGSLELSVPGEHNKANAMAALTVGMELLQLDFDRVAESLSCFTGVDRRFQIIGEYDNVVVVDDYAHHPTEVIATLQAAKQYLEQRRHNKARLDRVVVLFQPHQPGRLRDLWQEFCGAFAAADVVLLADVYVARGGEIENINSQRLAQEIKHNNVHYLKGAATTLPEQVFAYIQPGDLVLTVGAGDVTTVGPELIKHLRGKQTHGSSI